MPKNDAKRTLEYRTVHKSEQQKKPFWPRDREFWVELAGEAIFGLIVIWLAFHFGFGMF